MTAILALLLAGGLLVWFVRLERGRRPVLVIAFLLAVVIVEAAIYQSQNEIPDGIFHPEYGALSFRLLDVLIPAAILARLLQPKRAATPLNPTVLLWLALLAWLATAGVIGLYDGNPTKLVGFHAKAIIYLGALVLAAGVPLEQYVARRRLERFLAPTAALALALIASDIAQVDITADLPLLPLQDLGTMGSDAATIFSGLGALALAIGLFSDERRGRLLAFAVPLLVSPAVADQRAAFIGLALALATVVIGVLLSRRRVRVTATEGALAVAAVGAILLVSALPGVVADRSVKLPLQDRLTTTFGSYEEVLTTRDRLNQWSAARRLVAERPILGWGLGEQYTYYDPGHLVFRQIDLTHNIFGDVLLRTGAVGLALFLLALGATAAGVAGTWWREADDRAAAFALGAGAVVAGLLGKGMAESVFEKYRLAVVLGLAIGAVIAAGHPARRGGASRAGAASSRGRDLRLAEDLV
ncbi:MAG TPA: O-antigen ligase family protein [Solirubrobacteraceae bacterium]|nr:O-antigen ligase family protein [Solirubrobacteraceae bacterium]